MAYFKAQIGPPPASEPSPAGDSKPEQKTKPITTQPEAQKPTGKQPFAQTSLFAAQLGQQPAGPEQSVFAKQPVVSPAPPQEATPAAPTPSLTCPLCGQTLQKKSGLYQCQGRCRASWLEDATGHLVDLAALPFGICSCCHQPQALVRGDRGAVCPVSGGEYLLLPEGPTPIATAAPHGLCQCCQPPMPLLRQETGKIFVCQAKPYQQYEQQGGQLTLISPNAGTTSPTETLNAIDEALRRNSARLTTNGLFDLD